MAKPTFAIKAPRYRGNTSAEINEMFQAIETDLHSAYIDTVSLRQRIRELQMAIAYEQMSLSSRVSNMGNQLDDIIATITENNNTYPQIIMRGFDSIADVIYYPTNIVAEYNRATVNTMYRTCHLPISSDVSQIRYTDLATGNTIVNANTKVTVRGLSEGAYGESDGEVEETDPQNMLDGAASTFYQRRVKFPIYSAQPAVECEILIELPQTFDSYTNTVLIQPFPEGGLTVLSVDFAPVSNPSSFISIDESKFANGPLRSSTRLAFRINKVEAGALRIRLRQDRWTIEDNQKVFTYGIRDLDIRRTIYNTTGELGMVFSIPSHISGYFNQITGFAVTPENAPGARSFTLYRDYASFVAKSGGTRLSDTSLIDVRASTTRDLYVGISLSHTIPDGGSPIVENMVLKYTKF